MSIEPIPLSEREKQTQKILDFAQDMYDDEDYAKYVWYVGKSADGGKTWIQTAGRLPVGQDITCKPTNEIAPISMAQTTTLDPTHYTIKAVSASEFVPENHPITLLRTQHENTPKSAWQAPPGKDDYTLTFDLGELRVIGSVEIWPTNAGKYHVNIGTSSSPNSFVDMLSGLDFENVGPSSDFPLPFLVKARYVQLKTNCNAIKQVRILSMSENASGEERARLSREFYEEQTKQRRKA